MKYSIGVSNMDVALRPLMEKRLPVQGKITGEIQLGKQAGRYLPVEICGRQAFWRISSSSICRFAI